MLMRSRGGRKGSLTSRPGTALVDGADLLTFNRAHFSRVPGLTLAEV